MNTKALGANIQKRRKELGIKQEELAYMCQRSSTYMSALERGVKTSKLDTFIRIANILESSADILLTDSLDIKTQTISSELSKKLSALPDDKQSRILRVVDVMIADASSKK